MADLKEIQRVGHSVDLLVELSEYLSVVKLGNLMVGLSAEMLVSLKERKRVG